MITTRSFSRILSIAFLLLCGADINAYAQVSSPLCPTVSVSAPDIVKAGQNITMSANVSGGDTNVTPTYNWTLSDGTIEEGQGTSTITITTKGLKGDSPITATVDIGGYDRSCSTSDSETTMVMAGAEARKTDEFPPIATKDKNARLANFAIELQSEPTAKGYIIVHGVKNNVKLSAQTAGNAAKNFLVSKHKIDAARIVTLDGGDSPQIMTELWIVPDGADAPEGELIINQNSAKPVKKAPAKKVKGKKA